MSKEEKYYSFQNILKVIGFDYEFDKKNKEYPFNRGKDNVYFSWGQIIIPNPDKPEKFCITSKFQVQ